MRSAISARSAKKSFPSGIPRMIQVGLVDERGLIISAHDFKEFRSKLLEELERNCARRFEEFLHGAVHLGLS